MYMYTSLIIISHFVGSYVRQAILSALCTVVLTTPTHSLMNEVNEAIVEALQWVEGRGIAECHIVWC